MECNESLKQLYQYAEDYDFQGFQLLLLEAEGRYPPERLKEAYLMRGQIKLYAADESFLEDLERGGTGGTGGESAFPCLNGKWQPDTPNRFAVFNSAAGGLERFVRRLAEGEELLERSFGAAGRSMAWQIHSEILYFSGRIDEAVAIAEKQQYVFPVNAMDAILSQCTMFRCHLAKGAPEKAEEHMLNMIRLSKTYPECVLSYQSIRRWASATTGWSGDNPRFYSTPQGESMPVLDDRLHTIREGYSRMSPLENAFVDYGRDSYQDAYPMRSYYMDIFNAVFWLQMEDFLQAEEHFLRAYRTAANSGLIMPLVEYGAQLLPLLDHVSRSDLDVPAAWLEDIACRAGAYEDSLSAYRS